MNLGGYANRVARVDLTKGSVTYEPIDEGDARKYIGARGLGVKYLLDAGPGVDPMGPDNLLCIMNGPLSGTEVTMSGRCAVVTKSPLTGTCTDSHLGGWTAAKLKWAGFDGVVFSGKSNAPVYALAQDNQVTLHDASDLWGKGVHEVVRMMKERYGDEVAVLSIGQAGENLVRYASMINENDRAAGRGGTGCVAGSKNLKCLVVLGDKKKMFKPADRESWKKAHQVALKAIMDSPVTGPRKGGLSVFGTNVLMNAVNEVGGLGTRNSQTTNYEHAYDLSGEAIKETILIDDPTCHACPVACKKEVEITEGPYKIKMESFEYEPAWSLGSNCGNASKEVVAYIIDQCNDYGFDAIEHGNVLSVYMEATQRGLIEGLRWGDGDGMVRVTREIAFRQGDGDIMAEGTARSAASFGAPELAMTVKGQAVAAYDPRAIKGEGLGYATSNRGACHLRGYTPASELLGVPVKTDPLAWEGKGALLKIFQDLHAASDSFDLCKFSAFAEDADVYAMQYSAIVGIPFTGDDVMTAGERIYNLERYYNNLNGFTGKDDSLPRRYLEEPGTGAASGSVCELDLMKEEYYKARGWEDGVVPEAKLRELEIELVAV
ncbi:MAG: aldehyde ferredoxin oxidoreductase family protein [Dehalococcoidia bacterium]